MTRHRPGSKRGRRRRGPRGAGDRRSAAQDAGPERPRSAGPERPKSAGPEQQKSGGPERPNSAGPERPRSAGPPPPRAAAAAGRRDAWLALAALALLLIVAYRNVVFDGRSIVFSNNYSPLDPRFMPQNYGKDFVPPSVWLDQNLLFTANFNDGAAPVWQWEPDAKLLRRSLLAGELPLWNPYVGAGTPEMANLVPAEVFPPYLAMVLLGDGVELRNAYHLLLDLAAGLFTFLFLRRHGLSRLACLAGAAAFMLSGALTQNIGSFLGQTAACIPFVLYLTRCFLDRPTPILGVGMAAGYATVALASFPPILVEGFGFALLYATAAILLGAPPAGGMTRGRLLASYAAWIALAMGLVAFYYLPAAALARVTPQVGRAYAGAARIAIRPTTLLEVVSPILVKADMILRQAPPSKVSGEQPHLPYPGWLPLLLCAFALPRPRTGGRALWAATWTGLALLLMKLLGWPPVQWIAYLPLLANLHWAHYLGYLLDLLVALLAALGLERLRRGEVTVPLAAGAGLGGALLLLWIRFRFAPPGTFAGRWAAQWEGEWRLLAGIAVAGAALFAAGAWLARREKSTTVVAAALLALFAGEAVTHTYYPRAKAFDVWRQPPDYVRLLTRAAGYGRVFTKIVLPANAGAAFGVFQLESLMAYNAPRVLELYRRYADPGAWTFLTNPRLIPPESVLDRAAVALLALPSPSPEALSRGYELLYDDGFTSVFGRRGSPHYFFSSEFEVVPEDRALAEIGRLPPGRTVVLEAAPPAPAAANRPDDPAVTIAAFLPNRYRLRLDAPRPGLVFCADSLMPGWTARVNGRPAAILAANYAFRAVPVPAGRCEIELSYWAPGLTPGLVLTALAAAIAAGVAWRSWRRPGTRPVT